MKVVLSDEDRIKSWELIIDSVDKTDIPIEFVQVINIEYHEPIDGESGQDIDLRELRAHGYSNNDLEIIMSEVMYENESNIKSVNFYLNVEYIADVVERHTSVLLGGVK